MSETRADDFYTEKQLTETLEKAEENARSDEATKFVDDMTRAVAKWGLQAFMSDAQYNWLEDIAEGKRT